MPQPTVFIVDDDDAVRAALVLLVTSYGWRARACASAEEFLDSYSRDEPACLLLDLQMPGMSGADLQEVFADLDIRPHTIVVTAYKDHPLAERARRAGAVAVLAKPFRDQELIRHIQDALGLDD
jgi:FixJ family two-component response regulator